MLHPLFHPHPQQEEEELKNGVGDWPNISLTRSLYFLRDVTGSADALRLKAEGGGCSWNEGVLH